MIGSAIGGNGNCVNGVIITNLEAISSRLDQSEDAPSFPLLDPSRALPLGNRIFRQLVFKSRKSSPFHAGDGSLRIPAPKLHVPEHSCSNSLSLSLSLSLGPYRVLPIRSLITRRESALPWSRRILSRCSARWPVMISLYQMAAAGPRIACVADTVQNFNQTWLKFLELPKQSDRESIGPSVSKLSFDSVGGTLSKVVLVQTNHRSRLHECTSWSSNHRSSFFYTCFFLGGGEGQ